MKLNASRKIGCLLLTTLLSGCSVLSPVKLPEQNKFVLSNIPAVDKKISSRPVTILVMAPDTQQVYNTSEMAYSLKPYQVSFYSQNQWGETPAQMFEPLIVSTLQNSHAFHAVVTLPYLGHYDYSLYTDIIQIQQDFTRRPAMAEVTLRAELTSMKSNRVIATRQFAVEEPIQQQAPYYGVLAISKATTTLLAELRAFCEQNIDRP